MVNRSWKKIWKKPRKEDQTAKHQAAHKQDELILYEEHKPTEPLISSSPAKDDDVGAESLARTNAAFYNHSLRGDQIRLLVILPGESDDDIICDLEEHDLETTPDFDALSYCWKTVPGISNEFMYCRHTFPATYTVFINGVEGFVVQKHVFQALRRLRVETSKRCIWVDALCVNQANEEEKSQQVANMRRIYSRTNQCIIWLGESEPDEPNCRIRPNGYCTEPGLSSVVHGNVVQMFNEKIRFDERLSRTNEYQNQVWWKRLWILQEFALPISDPKIMIGPHTISWPFFAQLEWHRGNSENLLFKLREVPNLDRFIMNSDVGSLPASGGEGAARYDLYDLLLMTAGKFFCGDPRDRIFALMGLVSDASMPIHVNYSTGADSLYADALMYIIHKHGTLDVLMDSWDLRREQHTSLWIPDLANLLTPNLSRSPDGYRASSHKPVAELLRPLSEVPTLLKFRGVHFDTIISRTFPESVVVPFAKFCFDSDGALRNISKYNLGPDTWSRGAFVHDKYALETACVDRNLETPTRILHELSFEYTSAGRFRLDRLPQVGYLMLEYIFNGTRSLVDLIGEVERNEEVAEQSREAAREFGLKASGRVLRDLNVARSWEDWFLLKWHSCKKGTDKIARIPDNALEKRVRKAFADHGLKLFDARDAVLHTRRDGFLTTSNPGPKIPMSGKYRTFFRTEDNFIGLGPENLAVGDHIVVPLGSSRPWILRKHGEYYKLLGSAVIPCIMSGELLDFYDEGTLEAEDFVLV